MRTTPHLASIPLCDWDSKEISVHAGARKFLRDPCCRVPGAISRDCRDPNIPNKSEKGWKATKTGKQERAQIDFERLAFCNEVSGFSAEQEVLEGLWDLGFGARGRLNWHDNFVQPFHLFQLPKPPGFSNSTNSLCIVQLRKASAYDSAAGQGSLGLARRDGKYRGSFEHAKLLQLSVNSTSTKWFQVRPVARKNCARNILNQTNAHISQKKTTRQNPLG